jgi:alkylated DNA repair dioxygenase AlkB
VSLTAQTQADLFGSPGLPGLTLAHTVVGPAEEAALIAGIDAAGLAPFRYKQGWTGKRLTASFGWSYDFDTGGLDPTQALPAWLLPLRERAARFAGVAPKEFAQALLIRYDPGAGIGWHRDRPIFEHVLGISLGAPATLRFRKRRPGGFDRTSVFLAPRSIYHLTGEARHTWEHSIPPLPERRWSITFRSLARKAR